MDVITLMEAAKQVSPQFRAKKFFFLSGLAFPHPLPLSLSLLVVGPLVEELFLRLPIFFTLNISK